MYRNLIVRIGAPLIGALTLFHGFMVFTVNMPGSPVKSFVAPLLARYDGPQLSQGWMMFAPNPPQQNIHVLARGRTPKGRITPWYDVTLFFMDDVNKNRLSPRRELGEGLAHAAFVAAQAPDDPVSHAFVSRTCAMVLGLYARDLVEEQVEIEALPIPPPGSHLTAGVRARRLQWESIQNVSAL